MIQIFIYFFKFLQTCYWSRQFELHWYIPEFVIRTWNTKNRSNDILLRDKFRIQLTISDNLWFIVSLWITVCYFYDDVSLEKLGELLVVSYVILYLRILLVPITPIAKPHRCLNSKHCDNGLWIGIEWGAIPNYTFEFYV